MVSPRNSSTTSPAPEHLSTYPARLRRPLLMHAFNGAAKNRTAPGGSIVDVTENTDYAPGGEVAVTATVTMDGVLYARDLLPDRSQFTPIS